MDDVYDAERILEEKEEDGQMKYLIKWKGWSTKHNSWEPAENILDRRLFDAFERKKRKERRKTANLSKCSLDTTQNSEVPVQDHTLDSTAASNKTAVDQDDSTSKELTIKDETTKATTTTTTIATTTAATTSTTTTTITTTINTTASSTSSTTNNSIVDSGVAPAPTSQSQSPIKQEPEKAKSPKASDQEQRPVTLEKPTVPETTSESPTLASSSSPAKTQLVTDILSNGKTSPVKLFSPTLASAPSFTTITISDTQPSPIKRVLINEPTTPTKQPTNEPNLQKSSPVLTLSPAPKPKPASVEISKQVSELSPKIVTLNSSPSHATNNLGCAVMTSLTPIQKPSAPKSPIAKSTPTTVEISNKTSETQKSPLNKLALINSSPMAVPGTLPAPMVQKPVASKSTINRLPMKSSSSSTSRSQSKVGQIQTSKVKQFSTSTSPYQRQPSFDPYRFGNFVAVRVPHPSIQQTAPESSHVQNKHNTLQNACRPTPPVNPLMKSNAIRPKRNNLPSNNNSNINNNHITRPQLMVSQHIVPQQQTIGQCHETRIINQQPQMQLTSFSQQSNIQRVSNQMAAIQQKFSTPPQQQKITNQSALVQHVPMIHETVTPMDHEPIIENNDISDDSPLEQSLYLSDAAILGTVITDVTVNNQTISICECKTERGFFRDKDKHSVAVETVDD